VCSVCSPRPWQRVRSIMNDILASGLSQAHASAIGKISLTGDNSTVQLTQTWRHSGLAQVGS
jgi:hypothetical protein